MLGNANVAGMQEAYEAACHQHGHEPGPVFLPDRDTPSVCFVADDVDKAWDEIGQYLLHDVRDVRRWNPDNDVSAGFSDVKTVEELRDDPTSHRIYSVDEAVERVRAGEMLNLSPLCGGVPPEIAWPYLKRVGEVVMPEAATVTGASAVELYYDPYDFAIDDDPYPIVEAAARRGPAVLQREVQLLRAEPVRGRRPRTATTGRPTGPGAAPRWTSS